MSERLDSWKEIARYLRRDESTAQRWERREGMPVHRHRHDKRGSVYAYRSELDAWWQSRGQQVDRKKSSERESHNAAATIDARKDGTGITNTRDWAVRAAAVLALIVGGLLASRALPLFSTSGPGSGTRLLRLTSTAGLNIDPAISPDGSLLAYASDRGESGELDIWVQPTAAETPTRVTTSPGDELEPAFSPDGASIVFSKGETGGIHIVGAMGGEPRQLVSTPRAHTPRFSPDGKWVTYWTGLPAWAIPGAPGALGALFVVPAQGGAPRAIASGFAAARYGTWSPDGTKILFLGERRRDATQSTLDWYVADVGGGDPICTGASGLLHAAGVGGMAVPGAWTSNGVVFSTYDQGASNVWQLQVSAATGRATGAPVRLTFGTAIERGPSISTTGRLVFSSIAENVDVWRVRLDPATGIGSGSPERVTNNAANDRVFTVSGDGRVMVFLSSRTGREEVWTRDLHTGQERQMTFSGARGATLSRDGSMIAADRAEPDRRGVNLIQAGSGAAAPLCDDCGPHGWSPDGSRLLLERGVPARIVVHELGTARERELAAHPTWSLYQARFSPDGRWVLFHTANSPGLRQVYAVPADTDGAVPVQEWVPVVEDFGMQPNWAADGAGVYHFSLRDGAFCAWLQPVDPDTKRPVGAPRAVRHFHAPGLRAVAGAMVTNSVARGYLYVTLTASSANVWMLNP